MPNPTTPTSKRFHFENLARNDPKIREAFARICAILMATKSKDLECDFILGDKQYHFDVSEVATLKGKVI